MPFLFKNERPAQQQWHLYRHCTPPRQPFWTLANKSNPTVIVRVTAPAWSLTRATPGLSLGRMTSIFSDSDSRRSRLHFWWCRLRYGAAMTRCQLQRACHSSFRIRWIAILLAHVSHWSELYRAAFLHVMQSTGDACISTQRAHRIIHVCLSAEGACKGQCDVSMESACNLSIHVCQHRGQVILDPCDHYCDSSMIAW